MLTEAVQNADTEIPSVYNDAHPSDEVLMTPSLGTLGAGYKLGRYELLVPVAQGGMAVVWAARMKGTRSFSKIVAVKTMLPSLSGDPHFQELFLSEAELASRIRHPNVCEIFDLGEQRGVLYIVMEWIDGESLATLLSVCRSRSERVPFGIAARIGLEAARGLHAAHEMRSETGETIGLVHRDVSPQNILVTFDGIVKIVDFGVAKAMARSEGQTTQTGHVKGKVQYMAPEQAFCDAIDRRTDVFTLGIVLHQLTTGVHPFRADSDLATLARITSADPVPPPGEGIRGFPRMLGAVIEKALQKDPANRYATMADMARELEIVLAKLGALGEPVELEPFLRDLFAERAAERRAATNEALRRADERLAKESSSGKRPVPAELQGLADEGDMTARSESVTSGVVAVSSHRPPPRRSMGKTAALLVVGAGIGGAALWSLGVLGGGPRETDGPTAATAPKAPPSEPAPTPDVATAAPSIAAPEKASEEPADADAGALAAEMTPDAAAPLEVTPLPAPAPVAAKPTTAPKPTATTPKAKLRKPDF